MRENRKYFWVRADHHLLAKLTPRQGTRIRTPTASLGEGRTAYFREDQGQGVEVLCWCSPTTSHGTGMNYHALPISELDALNSMILLNNCVDVREGEPHFDTCVEAMDEIMDSFEQMRPDKILCAEGELASRHTWKKLLDPAGFRKGNPVVEESKVCYLGTYYNSSSSNFFASGVNGAVIVENFSPQRKAELGHDYVGPIYVSREISRPGSEFRTFKGFALPWINEGLSISLKDFYRKKPDSELTPIDKVARKMLGVGEEGPPKDIDPLLWAMVNNKRQPHNHGRRGR
jgi:hypothetical protein